MFRPKYILTVHNAEKNVVSLKMTKGTLVKYVVLPLVAQAAFWGGFVLIADRKVEENEEKTSKPHPYMDR